jgi:O-antigen/teichoic acid export membrane protein
MNAVARLSRQLRDFLAFSMDLIRHPGLHRHALFLAAATITSGLGSLVYWKLITGHFPIATVGLASTLISAATFLGGFANLGLTAGLVRFLPNREAPQKSGLVRAAAGLSLGAGFIFSALFWRWWTTQNSSDLLNGLIFLALVLSVAQLNTNTAVIQAEQRTPYLLAQSAIINTVQITGGALATAAMGAAAILFTYTLPIFVAAVVIYWFLPKISGLNPGVWGALPPDLPEMLRYAVKTQIFTLIWTLPVLVFPLLALQKIGAEASAGLALSLYAYNFLVIIPNSLTVALLVEGSHSPAQLPRQMWNALLTNLALLTPIALIICLLARLFLGFFGPQYLSAAPLLQLLTLSVLPVSVNGLYLTRWRVLKKMLPLNLFAAALTGLSIGLAAALIAPLGLAGIGWGWLLGQSAFALVVLGLLAREFFQLARRQPA